MREKQSLSTLSLLGVASLFILTLLYDISPSLAYLGGATNTIHATTFVTNGKCPNVNRRNTGTKDRSSKILSSPAAHKLSPNTRPSLPTSTSMYSSSSTNSRTTPKDYDRKIASCKEILNRAAETKQEDPDLVLSALEDLEKLMREKRKLEGDSVAQEVVSNLTGDWRLIFTTGTKSTQDRFKARINYFPLKAVQSFDSTKRPYKIENGIYAWDVPVLKFFGEFDFDLRKSKLEFDFYQFALFGLKIGISKDDAAKMGAASGLGSESNVKNVKKDRKAFFNWISADENIATARGGGGGLALWKRVRPGDD